ncbi:hypothetical protein AVEN_179216-1 [Araneus ventricosus]|uniref:Uncharacterized protein n=1 Tax=Araneus ventricosus TaxID=182803 RepID=A0A4Y2C7R6_ARAVE|nr:hypothetical protein AVEN_179216-1 [Araneus ventricosus]
MEIQTFRPQQSNSHRISVLTTGFGTTHSKWCGTELSRMSIFMVRRRNSNTVESLLSDNNGTSSMPGERLFWIIHYVSLGLLCSWLVMPCVGIAAFEVCRYVFRSIDSD